MNKEELSNEVNGNLELIAGERPPPVTNENRGVGKKPLLSVENIDIENNEIEQIEPKKADLKLAPEPENPETVPQPVYNIPVLEPLPQNLGILSKVYTSTEFMKSEQNDLVFIVDNLFYEQSLNLVVGCPKDGKSTFIRDLIKCLVDGEKFLNHETKPCKVLYLPLDEPNSLIKKGLKQVNPINSDNILISKLEFSDDHVFQDIVTICQNYQVKVVVVDVLDKLVSIQDSNSYSEVNRIMKKFRQISDTNNISFVILHHSSKSNPKNALGSQAFEGSVDNIISVYNNNEHYFYETNGRFDNIGQTEIILNRETYRLSVDELSGLSDKEKILKAIGKNDGLSGSEVAVMIKKNKGATLDLVKELENENRIVKLNGKYKLAITLRKEA